MIDVYLGLGSNMGNRRAHLTGALERLAARGVQLIRVSPVVESPAMLPDDAPADWNQPFLNLVAHCHTEAAPTDVLDGLKAIERELGRVDRGRWAPRTIDIDLLLYGRETLATDRLRVPHPGMRARVRSSSARGARAAARRSWRRPRTVLERACGRPSPAAVDGHHQLDARPARTARVDDAQPSRRESPSSSATARRSSIRRRVDATAAPLTGFDEGGAARARPRPTVDCHGRCCDRASASTIHVSRAPRARARRGHRQRRQRVDDARDDRARGDERRRVRRHAQSRRTGRQGTHVAGYPRPDDGRRALARGAAARVGARRHRRVTHRVRSGCRLRQERAAVVARLRNVNVCIDSACGCSSATRASRSCTTSRRPIGSIATCSRWAHRCSWPPRASTYCACTTWPRTPAPIAAGPTSKHRGEVLARASRHGERQHAEQQ